MTPTEAARRVCPNWMSPEGDIHFRDVLKALEEQRALPPLSAPAEAQMPLVVMTDAGWFIAEKPCEKLSGQ